MLLSSPKTRLITFSKTCLIKFYLNSHLMTDPIYIYTENKYNFAYKRKLNEHKKVMAVKC